MKTVTLRLVALSLLVGGVILGTGAKLAKADTFTFSTPTSAVDSAGEPVSATASLTTSSGQVSLTLTNTLSGSAVISAGQALSDLSFTLSTTPTGSVTGATTSDNLIDVGSGGSVTPVSGNPSRWVDPGHITTSASTITLLVLGGGTPSEMILPVGPYPGANASVTNGNFNPWVQGSATFILSVPGVTSATTVTATTFSFGTGPDTFVAGVPVPEPSTLAISGLGALGFIGYGLRRRLKK